MKLEMLDALLADRVLGELSPEVAALLAAYLAKDPAAAVRAAQFESTIALARSATAVPLERPAPLDLTGMARDYRVHRRNTIRFETLRLAAALAVGAGLGWALATVGVSHPPAERLATMSLVASPPPETRVHFWSMTRFVADSTNIQPRKMP